MAKHLYVCVPCRKQIEKILHRTEDIPETVPCPICGQYVRQWGVNPSSQQQATRDTLSSPKQLPKKRRG